LQVVSPRGDIAGGNLRHLVTPSVSQQSFSAVLDIVRRTKRDTQPRRWFRKIVRREARAAPAE
jgi:hypothetical protein